VTQCRVVAGYVAVVWMRKQTVFCQRHTMGWCCCGHFLHRDRWVNDSIITTVIIKCRHWHWRWLCVCHRVHCHDRCAQQQQVERMQHALLVLLHWHLGMCTSHHFNNIDSRHDDDLFVIGTETGAVVHCSMHSRDTLGAIGTHTIFNVCVLALRPHTGTVMCIDASQHHRSLFASCATDSTIHVSVCDCIVDDWWTQIYNALRVQPCARIVYDVGISLNCVRWLPGRPIIVIAACSNGDVCAFDISQRNTTTPIASASLGSDGMVNMLVWLCISCKME
jgi:WD40 repeat protein